MKLQTLKPRLATIVTQRVPTQEPERLRGRAAVERRQRWLQLHPLCKRCEDGGRVSVGAAVDHTIPLWAGGADDYESNGGTLCTEHHDAKTVCEARMRAAGGWLAAACTCGQHEGEGGANLSDPR